MNRTPIVAGNWKMHLNHLEAIQLVQKLSYELAEHDYAAVEVSVHPPFTALRSIQTVIDADRLEFMLGAQNCHSQSQGAHTGEVSAAMLAKLDVRYVIVGHSERRAAAVPGGSGAASTAGGSGTASTAGGSGTASTAGPPGETGEPGTAGPPGETDEQVAVKAAAVVSAEMLPIVCVGETQAEREAGRAQEVVATQLRGSLAKLRGAAFEELLVAYEPVWAIGTGATASPQDAQEMCAHVRAVVEGIKAKSGEGLRVLYGGSVKPDNARSLLRQLDIDGALVGGASLDAQQFALIVKAALP